LVYVSNSSAFATARVVRNLYRAPYIMYRERVQPRALFWSP
jgi:hypothetical protein